MTDTKDATSRRTFLTNTGRIAGVSALAGMALPHVHAAENNTIQLALVGCGGRGTGAADNALGQERSDQTGGHGRCVPEEARTTATDKLRRSSPTRWTCRRTASSSASTPTSKAMDCLKPGDVVILGHSAGVPLGAVHATPSTRA